MPDSGPARAAPRRLDLAVFLALVAFVVLSCPGLAFVRHGSPYDDAGEIVSAERTASGPIPHLDYETIYHRDSTTSSWRASSSSSRPTGRRSRTSSRSRSPRPPGPPGRTGRVFGRLLRDCVRRGAPDGGLSLLLGLGAFLARGVPDRPGTSRGFVDLKLSLLLGAVLGLPLARIVRLQRELAFTPDERLQ